MSKPHTARIARAIRTAHANYTINSENIIPLPEALEKFSETDPRRKKKSGGTASGAKSGGTGDSKESKTWRMRAAETFSHTAHGLNKSVMDFRSRYSGTLDGLDTLGRAVNGLVYQVQGLAEAKTPTSRALAIVRLAATMPTNVTDTLLALTKILANDDLQSVNDIDSGWTDAQGREYDPHMTTAQGLALLGLSWDDIVPSWLLAFMGLSKMTVWSVVPPVNNAVAFGRPMPDLFGRRRSAGFDDEIGASEVTSRDVPSYEKFQGFLTAELELPGGAAPVRLYWNRGRERYVNPDFAGSTSTYMSPDETSIFMSSEDKLRFMQAVFDKFWGQGMGVTLETGHVRRWTLDLSTIVETNALTELRDHMRILDNVADRDISRTVLLNGLPGAGKSYAAKVCAAERGWRALSYEASAFLRALRKDDDAESSFNSSEMLSTMAPVKLITMVRPDMLILDDVERIEDTGLLLDTLAAIKRAGVRWIVLTTNAITELDPAIVRPGRVDTIIEVDGLSESGLIKFFESSFIDDAALKAMVMPYAQKLRGWPYSYALEFATMVRGYRDANKAYRIMAPRVEAALKVYSETRLWQPTKDNDSTVAAEADATSKVVPAEQAQSTQALSFGLTQGFSAPTEQEAVGLAALFFGVRPDQIEYTVLDVGSPGILGLGMRDACIRVDYLKHGTAQTVYALPKQEGHAQGSLHDASEIFDLTELEDDVEDGTKVAG